MKLPVPEPLRQILILKGVGRGDVAVFNELPRCLLRGLGKEMEKPRSCQYWDFMVSDASNEKQGSCKGKLAG